jgi:hypothetical protein
MRTHLESVAPRPSNAMSIGIKLRDGESWKECAVRLAEPYDLQEEVIEVYDRAIERGCTEDDAALEACMEWDVAELLPDEDEDQQDD